jgi:hypothetical protein
MTTVLPVHTEHAAAEHVGLELLPVVQSHMGGSESGVGWHSHVVVVRGREALGEPPTPHGMRPSVD